MTTEVPTFVSKMYMVFCVNSVWGLQFEYSWEKSDGVLLAAAKIQPYALY